MTVGINSDITAHSSSENVVVFFQRESHCLQCASSIMDEEEKKKKRQRGRERARERVREGEDYKD